MSLYADYLRERTNDKIIETPEGFASYRYLNEGRTVYIVDIFVVASKRKRGYAAELADIIVAEAKAKGAKEVLGTVMPSSKGSTVSLKVLLAYGMELISANNDCIILKKDI